MLTKTSGGVANGPRLKKALAGVIGGSMDRRTFLKRSGVTAGGAVLASAMPIGIMAERRIVIKCSMVRAVAAMLKPMSTHPTIPPWTRMSLNPDSGGSLASPVV